METLRDIIITALGDGSTHEQRRIAFVQALQAGPDREATAFLVRELTPTPEATSHTIEPPAPEATRADTFEPLVRAAEEDDHGFTG